MKRSNRKKETVLTVSDVFFTAIHQNTRIYHTIFILFVRFLEYLFLKIPKILPLSQVMLGQVDDYYTWRDIRPLCYSKSHKCESPDPHRSTKRFDYTTNLLKWLISVPATSVGSPKLCSFWCSLRCFLFTYFYALNRVY